MKILLDTSALVRFCQTADPSHHLLLDAVARLSELDCEVCIVPQVIYELWSVSIRLKNEWTLPRSEGSFWRTLSSNLSGILKLNVPSFATP